MCIFFIRFLSRVPSFRCLLLCMGRLISLIVWGITLVGIVISIVVVGVGVVVFTIINLPSYFDHRLGNLDSPCIYNTIVNDVFVLGPKLGFVIFVDRLRTVLVVLVYFNKSLLDKGFLDFESLGYHLHKRV